MRNLSSENSVEDYLRKEELFRIKIRVKIIIIEK